MTDTDGQHDAGDDGAAARVTEPAFAEVWTLAWFPPAERERAISLWPPLAPDLTDDETYRRGLERELRALAAHSSRHPHLVSLRVDELLAFAEREGLDAGAAEARNRYAAAEAGAGAAEAWPPGRNEPCWCGSGRKYKRCCGAF